MAATKRTPKREDRDDDDGYDVDVDEPTTDPAAITTKETDFLGRAIVTPGTDARDFLGRATTATADHLGRLLVDV